MVGAVDPGREFIIGEGIESTLSAIKLFGAHAGCAALSAYEIHSLILPPEAKRVRIFADNDNSAKASLPRGRRPVPVED